MTLSSYYPHKNLEVINRVTQIFKERGEARFKFIVTLPDEQYHNTFGTNDTGLIFNTGPVSIKECPSLYDECDIMFLPTLLECFSASYAEAMVMKKPILTSDMSFARTVCLNAAVYFNPLDPYEIAGKISMLAGDPELQIRLINEGEFIARNFNNPYERADKFLRICQDTVGLRSGS
ncbi:MAG: glycosyltransferase [Bacteroidales bacterium]|nr:glycosyltransferase [Bacteroidales bacterium]